MGQDGRKVGVRVVVGRGERDVLKKKGMYPTLGLVEGGLGDREEVDMSTESFRAFQDCLGRRVNM
jgi:hypothetical protein